MPKCPCLYCDVHLEFEEPQENQDVTCPNCGQTTTLFIKRQAANSTAEAPVARQVKPEPGTPSPWEHLVSVRAATSYKALRTVIGVCFFIWVAISVLVVVMGCFEFFETLYTRGVTEVGIGLLFISIGLLSGVLCAASWQATILLIDIADLLIHISRGRRG